MKKLSFAVIACLFALTVGPALSEIRQSHHYGEQVVAHGGGCRKSSPQGQCCHMNRKTGFVHCH